MKFREEHTMKHLMEVGERYIKNMSIWDMALLKFCLCAVGIMIGMAMPKKSKKYMVFAATGVFAVTYVVLMMPFLKLFSEEK